VCVCVCVCVCVWWNCIWISKSASAGDSGVSV